MTAKRNTLMCSAHKDPDRQPSTRKKQEGGSRKWEIGNEHRKTRERMIMVLTSPHRWPQSNHSRCHCYPAVSDTHPSAHTCIVSYRNTQAQACSSSMSQTMTDSFGRCAHFSPTRRVLPAAHGMCTPSRFHTGGLACFCTSSCNDYHTPDQPCTTEKDIQS